MTTEVAFVDESYDATAEIYVVGGLIVDRAAIPTLLVSLDAERTRPSLPDKGHFHWRSAGVGRRKAFVAATITSHNLSVYGVVKERVTPGQQETAREACLGRFVAEIVAAGANEIILDKRDSAGKLYLDNRTMGRLRNSGTMPAGMVHRLEHPSTHQLLRVADAVSGLTMAAVAMLDTQYLQLLKTLKICLVA